MQPRGIGGAVAPIPAPENPYPYEVYVGPPPEFTPPPVGLRGVREGDSDYFFKVPLMVPVLGVSPDQVPDTYEAGRSGGRTHRATDIIVPKGTPVLAAAPGVILRISNNPLGGRTIYKLDLHSKFLYYYAHLDSYARGLKEGQYVSQGVVIGYVGSTGNATTPHLHFQGMRWDPNKRNYWDAEPLDVRSFFSLTGKEKQ